MESIYKKKLIFGSLFLLANRLQVIGDKYLEKEGITTKQWLLIVMIAQFADSIPTLSEVAQIMGSSRQNVKQLALRLQEKGFVSIKKDERDSRVLRLKLTEKSTVFWEERREKDEQFIIDIFNGLSEEEIHIMCNGFNKLFGNIESIEKIYK
ncbi:MAG: MarR family transcriptional regulator [Clostridiaceae bacterium]